MEEKHYFVIIKKECTAIIEGQFDWYKSSSTTTYVYINKMYGYNLAFLDNYIKGSKIALGNDAVEPNFKTLQEASYYTIKMIFA